MYWFGCLYCDVGMKLLLLFYLLVLVVSCLFVSFYHTIATKDVIRHSWLSKKYPNEPKEIAFLNLLSLMSAQ